MPMFQPSVSGDGLSMSQQLHSLMSSAGRTLKLHVYGNSLDQEDRYWRGVCAGSGGSLTLLRNSAMGGYRSDQILAKMLAEGFDPEADIVAFGEGTNDALASVPLATSMSQIASCIALIRAAGKIPLLRLPPPNENAWNSRVMENWFAQLVLAERLNVFAHDAYAKYVDTDGTYPASFPNDNTHPLAPQYSIVAAEAYANMMATPRPYWLPRNNTGQGLLQNNVLQLTDAASPAEMPAGWDTFGSIPSAVWAARTDYPYPFRGKRASVSIAQSTNSTITKSVAIGATVSVGDRVRMTGVFGCAGVSNANCVMYIRCAGPNVDTYAINTSAATDDRYVTAEVVVPAGTTAVQVFIRALPTVAGAYTATLSFGAVDVYNITRNTFV